MVYRLTPENPIKLIKESDFQANNRMITVKSQAGYQLQLFVTTDYWNEHYKVYSQFYSEDWKRIFLIDGQFLNGTLIFAASAGVVLPSPKCDLR